MDNVEELLSLLGDQSLSHRVYDPVAAREYYLKTRHLKGRQRAAPVDSKGRPIARGVVSKTRPVGHTPIKPLANKAVVKPVHKKSTAQSNQDLTAKVAYLQRRLAYLHTVLAALVRQVQVLNGIKPVKKTASTKSSRTRGASKLTGTQKAHHAQAVKKYNATHKKPMDQQAKDLQVKIAEVKKKIEKMRADLALARHQATAANKKPVISSTNKPVINGGNKSNVHH